jgi:excisionase family DNA binding protein
MRNASPLVKRRSFEALSIQLKSTLGAAMPDDALPPFRPDELAARWRVHGQTIRALLRSGRLRGFRVHKLWLIPREVVAEVERGGDPPGQRLTANDVANALEREAARLRRRTPKAA